MNPDANRAKAWPREQVIIWRRLDMPGAEYCSFRNDGGKWHVQGTVVLALDGRPLQAHYRVTCNSRWETEEVSIDLELEGESRTLRLSADEERRWWSEDHELRDVRGCLDVDLGITPSTNTLPIQRLGLAVGQAADVRATWVKFPELEVLPLQQVYTRLDEHTYRYESNNGFTADLTVDSSGIVTYYPGGWERAAVDDRPPTTGD